MSAIDGYAHTCIGQVDCPSPYEIIAGRRAEWRGTPTPVMIYRLDEDVRGSETTFDGKRGDILLGGGNGEAPAMRVSVPEAFYVSTNIFVDGEEAVWDGWERMEEIVEAYWSHNDAFTLGAGYALLGWHPDADGLIEYWLMDHLLAFLVREYPNDYQRYVGPRPLEQDGAICHRLDAEAAAFFARLREGRERHTREKALSSRSSPR